MHLSMVALEYNNNIEFYLLTSLINQWYIYSGTNISIVGCHVIKLIINNNIPGLLLYQNIEVGCDRGSD